MYVYIDPTYTHICLHTTFPMYAGIWVSVFPESGNFDPRFDVPERDFFSPRALRIFVIERSPHALTLMHFRKIFWHDPPRLHQIFNDSDFQRVRILDGLHLIKISR